jgi:hypothetical protein
MNGKMAALLQKASLRWPLVARAFPTQLPTFEIFEDCVLLKDQWDPNGHVKVKDCFDKTGFECFINHVHFHFAGTNESLVSCLERAATLQEALLPLTPDRQFRVIVYLSEDECDGTVRFHQIRLGEDWIAEDLEGYKSEAILVFDVPSSRELLSLAI